MASTNLNFLGNKAKSNKEINVSNTKRSAENSPGNDCKKRSVLCNVTNRENDVNAKKNNHNVQIKAAKLIASQSVLKYNEFSKKSESKIKPNLESSLATQHLKEPEVECKSNRDVEVASDISPDSVCLDLSHSFTVPPDVTNFDEESKNDPTSEAKYAQYIFEYYKEREKKFVIEKYIGRQPDMNKSMRAILVDWMVEVQESFELNHETLYLAVKLVDMYLMKHVVPKTMIQLVGATAAFIASKYDERIPPLIDDFLYICDDSYTRSELISMECNILKTVDFDLGIPISYRFLRRYARCGKINMETLTLARFVLETSLMEYELIDTRDSKIAAAALLLALKMKNIGEWTPTLQYYSGYKEEDLADLMKQLNKLISSPPNKHVLTIRTKYSHKIFFEVAKISPLTLD